MVLGKNVFHAKALVHTLVRTMPNDLVRTMPNDLVRTLVRTIAFECMTRTVVRTALYNLVRTISLTLITGEDYELHLGIIIHNIYCMCGIIDAR